MFSKTEVEDTAWLDLHSPKVGLSDREVRAFIERVALYQDGGKVELEEARNRAFSSLGGVK